MTTALFPLPNHPALPIQANGSMPQIPVRALAQLLARRPILANVTDQSISLAQFNCLMADHAAPNGKHGLLLYKVGLVLSDPLNGFIENNRPFFDLNITDGLAGLWPKHSGHMTAINDLVSATMNTVLCHLSQHGNPNNPTLPIKRKLRALMPDEAAWQWAEAMEAQLHQTQIAKAG